MKKPKIAISLDSNLLRLVDSKVDGKVIRSRSQSVEVFLRKGLQEHSITNAVILLKGSHQTIALKKIQGTTLFEKQLSFFHSYGITDIYVVTQKTSDTEKLVAMGKQSSTTVHLVETTAHNNAQALQSLQYTLKQPFVAISGDTYHEFDLYKLIKKHADMEKLATMGLMTRAETKNYGTAILDGDFIIDFHEKPKKSSTTIVNAGIYVFNPEVFELLKDAASLERDVFPKLARLRQLIGFFTYGEYDHLG